MFISVLELFKVGIGPSSSHTMGPMVAAHDFLTILEQYLAQELTQETLSIQVVLKGSLAFTGKGHGTDRAVLLGMHGYTPENVAYKPIEDVVKQCLAIDFIKISQQNIYFNAQKSIIFDTTNPLKEHPNGMIFSLLTGKETLLEQVYFSIGGGFINKLEDMHTLIAPLKTSKTLICRYPFHSANSMLAMANANHFTIASMKRNNEEQYQSSVTLNEGLDAIYLAMITCIKNGLTTQGILPGGLRVKRRAKYLHDQLITQPKTVNINDWLTAYALAVSEENAAGHLVVTSPTNGAAGVIPAIIYYLLEHEGINQEAVYDFLLTASAIGGIIKHNSSISGAEVGCQGEIGVASSMAAAGLCAVRGGTPEQIENAAEMALEHHLGMTCDPVKGLVQVPCIERNSFGAIKAYAAASLALRESGQHFMPLDNCILAMKKTGQEMSDKYKETARGGLAVSITEC